MTHDGTDDRDGPAEERALEQLLGDMRRSYHTPPATPPLDTIWAGIEREHFRARGARVPAGGWGGVRGFWWMAIAAALVVGVGIGRLTTKAPQVVAGDDVSRLASRPAQGAPANRVDPTAAYDRTTARYLGQTAALLIALPTEARAGRTDQRFVARAAELLTTTRLLLDSPAAGDPKVRALLEDLELVLAQVAHLDSDGGRVELELIAQALEQRDLLSRLTSAAAGSTEADD
jgi:hypothetical protein